MIKFSVASICSAFKSQTIGTKVLDHEAFIAALGAAVESYEMPVSGHGMVSVDAVSTVSCGVANGAASLKQDEVVARQRRGVWGAYARRDMAAKADSVAAIVFTREAYLADPDVTESVEEGITHVIVAVLAFVGPKSPLPYWTLVHNIAGGNTDRIIEMAKETEQYWSEWMVVAD